MKKIIFTLTLLLIGGVTFSSNITLRNDSYEEAPDCYEEAFDAMQEAIDAGLSSWDVSIVGERAYCECQPNCEWNP